MPVVAVQPQFPPEAPRSRPRDAVRVYLGWDLGESLGYGVVDEAGRHVRSGRLNLARVGKERDGARILRASRAIGALYAELMDPSKGYQLAGVAYEYVNAHSAYLAAQMYGSWKAVLLGVSESAGVDPAKVLVSEIKRLATGKGGGPQATKDHIVFAAASRWPEFDRDAKGAADAADALYCAEALRVATLERYRIPRGATA